MIVAGMGGRQRSYSIDSRIWLEPCREKGCLSDNNSMPRLVLSDANPVTHGTSISDMFPIPTERVA